MGTALAAWFLSGSLVGWPKAAPVVWGGMLILSLMTAALAAALVDAAQRSADLKLRLEKNEASRAEVQRQFDSVMRLGRQLVEAEDEKTLLDQALDIFTEMTGALASSFVPLDEAGEPLAALVHGNLPQPVLGAWAEHLASHLVRQMCSHCNEHHAGPGEICPLLHGPFADALSVYCFPLKQGARTIGLLNVYFGSHHSLNETTRQFLEGLLNEIGNALQVVRLRNQELTLLREIQSARANRGDLSITLTRLLESLRQTFPVQGAWLQTRGGEHLPEIKVFIGDGDWRQLEETLNFYARLLQDKKVLLTEPPLPAGAGAPLILPDGQAIGAVILCMPSLIELTPHQTHVLQNTAMQAAWVIESERTRASLEFALVIQERHRLAREIHDGLAQTLAYLKLQAAQMQRALAQNEPEELKTLISQNYNALSDAYLDARQAIDNLRLTPAEGMPQWLAQAAREFEQLSHIPVRCSFEPVSLEIPSEMQAQLVRIVQEVFTNIRKHAHATQAWMLLKEWDGDIVLEIGDNGRGFQPKEAPALSQYGLRGMRERAELIGADFQIASRPGEGTLVMVRLPANLWETFR